MSRQGFGLCIDILSIEHLIGAFEQLTDGSAMQFQAQAAQSQRTNRDFAVTLFALVGRLDATDTERRLRIAVGDEFDRRVALPVLFMEQRDRAVAAIHATLNIHENSRLSTTQT